MNEAPRQLCFGFADDGERAAVSRTTLYWRARIDRAVRQAAAHIERRCSESAVASVPAVPRRIQRAARDRRKARAAHRVPNESARFRDIKNLKYIGQGAALCQSNDDARKFADAVYDAAAGDFLAVIKAVKFGADVNLVAFDFMETATRHIARQTLIEKAEKAAKAAAAAAAAPVAAIPVAAPATTPRARPATRTLPGLGAVVRSGEMCNSRGRHGQKCRYCTHFGVLL
jgi:hypothetical protein